MSIFLTPQDTSLAAQAANLSTIPFGIGSVPLDDFRVMLSSWRLRYPQHLPAGRSELPGAAP